MVGPQLPKLMAYLTSLKQTFKQPAPMTEMGRFLPLSIADPERPLHALRYSVKLI